MGKGPKLRLSFQNQILIAPSSCFSQNTNSSILSVTVLLLIREEYSCVLWQEGQQNVRVGTHKANLLRMTFLLILTHSQDNPFDRYYSKGERTKSQRWGREQGPANPELES